MTGACNPYARGGAGQPLAGNVSQDPKDTRNYVFDADRIDQHRLFEAALFHTPKTKESTSVLDFCSHDESISEHGSDSDNLGMPGLILNQDPNEAEISPDESDIEGFENMWKGTRDELKIRAPTSLPGQLKEQRMIEIRNDDRRAKRAERIAVKEAKEVQARREEQARASMRERARQKQESQENSEPKD